MPDLTARKPPAWSPVYWRLHCWWYLDTWLQQPIVWTRRLCGPPARACGRRYLREFRRLEARGLVPVEEDEGFRWLGH